MDRSKRPYILRYIFIVLSILSALYFTTISLNQDEPDINYILTLEKQL